MNLRDFAGPNAGYVLELYDRYRRDPSSVDAQTRAVFDAWTPELDSIAKPAATSGVGLEKVVGAVNYAQAIREHGHLAAHLDPLGTPPLGDPMLDPAAHGIDEHDLRQLPASLIGGPIAEGAANAFEAITALRAVYSATTGYDYDHVRSPEERAWLRYAAEARPFSLTADPVNPLNLLERLTQIESFERFLHRIFPGKSRFSLEGLDMMVPILDEVISSAAEIGIRNMLIGMAHRGRLNVLAHILNKPYSQILAEFKDPLQAPKFREDLGWTGDVKYHKGERREVKGGERIDLIIAMAPNPSHLEAVDPVVVGMARAAGTQVDQAGPPRFNQTVTLPILIHGDAAFPGQGVVAETLNFSRIPGYRVGGTIHIIANNQLGYTTPPKAGRSTLYAGDMAKGFEIPIVHVNADDPEACIEAARLAFEYRKKFQKDFLIDLIGYRRHGHNEGDEPSFTQPLMYQVIDAHPTVRELWAQKLIERGMIGSQNATEMVQRRMDDMQGVLEKLNAEESLVEPQPEPPPPGSARRVKTAVPLERLRKLNEALLSVPSDFAVNRKLEKAIARRRKTVENADEASIDWSTAEEFAFGSILEEGIAIRLTGQDVERGTFSQRHAVFHDVKTGSTFTPLQALSTAKAAYEVRNSPLSEGAAIGFEYGYNVQEPGRLVVWEAQYGDFINGAQVIIDEFVTSARAKWGQTPSLVLLLPHGYEGHGPDHSSGRLERFLELAAETNMRIANCTSAAQYFHLLRRQALLLRTDPLPLIVMTPKSLLRHPAVASAPKQLASGSWQPVIDDPQASKHPREAVRLVLSTGKICIDLAGSEFRGENGSVATVRVEQLYPFPSDFLQSILQSYQNVREIFWVQEEPENMGAWSFAHPYLEELANGRIPVRYIGRRRNSSPAEGSAAWHAYHQNEIIKRAFALEKVPV
jgi:2-oxoglutarate dehydrogenase E1 component